MKPGILRTLFIAYLGFGLAIGLLFALYTQFIAASEAGLQFGFTIGCILTGLAIGIGNYGISRYLLLRPLQQAIAPGLPDGNPDNNPPPAPVNADLVGEIINRFNQLTANAAEMVTRIGESTQTLERDSRQLSETAEQGRDKAQRQQAACRQAVQAITDIRNTVQQVTQMAEAVATSSAETDRSAKEGALIATEAIGSISGLIDDMNNAGKVISQLDEKSTSIGMVMDVIRNIAEQTNLLALNAAIEAARAGDQGRGFAVVADEVRTLATRTQESTLEIEGIIGHLQSGSRTAVGVMDNARERAMKTESHIEQAAELLAEMAGSIASLREVSDDLSNAAAEQDSFIGTAGDHMEQINHASLENAQATQGIAESSDSLNRQAIELTRILEQYR